MGSWKGRGNQYIQFVRVLCCKLPTNGKQLPAFPLEAVPGTEPRPQSWEARVLPLCHRGPPRLTLKEGYKVKSDHTKRFSTHDFLSVGLPSQTFRTNNKQVISTFKLAYPHLTLKEGPKVKYDHTKRFPAHDFL